MPSLDKFLRGNPLWEYIPYFATKESQISKIAMQAIAERQEGMVPDRKDLLSLLLEASEQNKSNFSLDQVYSNAFGFM